MEGAIGISGQCSVSLSTVVFTACVGGYGGALYISDNQEDVMITDCTFSYNTAILGGSIAIDSEVTSLIIDAADVSNSLAYVVGGGIYLGDMNDNSIIRHSDITNCFAASAGGGIYIGADNEDVVIDDVVVTDCEVTLDDISSIGGGIFVDSDNLGLLINAVTLSGCKGYSGGGIVLNDGNVNATMRGLQVTLCEATGGAGGGVSLVVDCDNFLLETSGFYYNQAYAFGGGLALGYGAGDYIVVRDSVFETCAAGIGGAIILGRDMSHILMQRLTISNCFAFFSGGGGIAVGQRIHNWVVESSTVEGCSAIGQRQVGGGVIIDSDNTHVTFKEVSFAGNYGYDGSAFFALSSNDYLSFVGCTFRNNVALRSGSAIMAMILKGLLVIDVEGFENKVTLESDHPYSVPLEYIPTISNPLYIIQNKTVQVDGAIEFVVLFDLQTMIGGSEAVNIYSSPDKVTLLHRFVQSFPSYIPGIDVPPIYIRGPTFYVEFVSEYIYEPGDNFGIIMHAYPVLVNPSAPCVFTANSAAIYGGAIRLVADVLAPVFINARFEGNVAGDSGGAIFFRSTISSGVVVRSSFTNNVAYNDGGAIMVLAVIENDRARHTA